MLAATNDYVCVRVTDMLGVDLTRFRFDYDLTFCALLMRADGTIYHTYGGRSKHDASQYLGVENLVDVLGRTLAEHRASDRRPPKAMPSPIGVKFVEELPPLKRRIDSGKHDGCVHCHSVHNIWTEHLQATGAWKSDLQWVYPDPIQVGLVMDPADPARVEEVVSNTPAKQAGVRPGDRLLKFQGQRILTFGDLQRALHETTGGRTRLEATVQRGDAEHELRLSVKRGWKEADPAVYAWRPFKWALSPKPGFGGPQLDPAQLKAAGLDEGTFAFRVNYIVTWGPNAYTGRHAAKAGIRRNDIVASVDGRNDFESVQHFHAWFRLTRKVGEVVEFRILRGGKEMRVDLTVLE